MAKESERMRLMKENFMELHQQGFSVSEIAERYNLSNKAAYNALQAIAEANGVSRESLLKVVRKLTTERAYKEEAKKVKVDVGELKKGFKEAGNLLDTMISIIDETLREEKENDNFDI